MEDGSVGARCVGESDGLELDLAATIRGRRRKKGGNGGFGRYLYALLPYVSLSLVILSHDGRLLIMQIKYAVRG